MTKRKLPRLARRIDDTHYDRIWKFFFVPNKTFELSQKEEILKARWEHIWDLLCGEILTDRQAVLAQNKKYPDLDIRTCYNDLYNAKRLFGDGRNGTKAQKRAFANEILIRRMNKCASLDNDKSLEKYMLRYTRINGLDDEDRDVLEKLLRKQRPAAIIFTTDPKDLQRQKKLLEQEEAIDIEHEEVEG